MDNSKNNNMAEKREKSSSKSSLAPQQPIGDHRSTGTDAPWYKGWALTNEERDRYRRIARDSHRRKARAESGDGPPPIHSINKPTLDPMELMPQARANGLAALSLFSGGGGLDLGFDRAGYDHIASYDFNDATGPTLRSARPAWTVFSGMEGDVTKVSWGQYAGMVDVLHGGPPCQPFSNSGRQAGAHDVRDMVPEFVRAVQEVKPAAFLMEMSLVLLVKSSPTIFRRCFSGR